MVVVILLLVMCLFYFMSCCCSSVGTGFRYSQVQGFLTCYGSDSSECTIPNIGKGTANAVGLWGSIDEICTSKKGTSSEWAKQRMGYYSSGKVKETNKGMICLAALNKLNQA